MGVKMSRMKHEAPEPTPIAGVPKRGGRALGWAALLVGLFALAVGGALFFQSQGEEAQLDRLGAGLQSQEVALRRLDRERITPIEWAKLVSSLDRTRLQLGALGHSVAGITQDARHVRSLGRIRESEMLLVIARRTLVFEPGRGAWALKVLETVQSLIRPLTAPALDPARGLLDAQIRLLEARLARHPLAVTRTLGSLALASTRWPLAEPGPPSRRIHKAAEKTEGFWRRIGGAIAVIFQSLVRIHHVPLAPAPPPGARQAAAIRLDLALDFSLAETAWLTGDRSAYRYDLGLLKRVIGGYYDRSDPDVRAGWRKLGALEHEPSGRESPDWRKLLRALGAGERELRRGQP